MTITYISYRNTIAHGNIYIIPYQLNSGKAQSVFTFGSYGVYPTNIRTLRLYLNYLFIYIKAYNKEKLIVLLPMSQIGFT